MNLNKLAETLEINYVISSTSVVGLKVINGSRALVVTSSHAASLAKAAEIATRHGFTSTVVVNALVIADKAVR